MKKETMWILGAVVVGGVLYFLLKKPKEEMVEVTDAHGFNLAAFAGDTSSLKSGFKFTTNFRLDNIIITKISSCTATKAYILDSDKNVLYTTDFIGDDATFTAEQALSKSTTYYMATDNDGSDYTRRLNYNDQSYPQNRININYNGALDGANDTLKAFNIISITTKEITGPFPTHFRV